MTSKTYEPVTPHKVAFLGLGVMGAPMARHLLAAGHQVTVYNRTPSKAQDWVKQNAKEGDRAARAKSAATPREAAKDAQIVFCCVGNDADLRSVVLGAAFLSTTPPRRPTSRASCTRPPPRPGWSSSTPRSRADRPAPRMGC